MTLYQSRLYGPALLTATAASIYDSSAPTTSATTESANVTIVKQVVACNTDSSSAYTFSLYCLEGGDTSAGAADLILNGVSLAAGETKIINLSLVLRAADSQTLYAVANVANKITLTLSGIEEY